MCSSNPKRRCYSHSCKTFEKLLNDRAETQAEMKEVEAELLSKKFMYGSIKNNESMSRTAKESAMKKVADEIESSEKKKEILTNALKANAYKITDAQADIDATRTGINDLENKLKTETAKPANEQNALAMAHMQVRLNSGKSRQAEMKATADRRKKNYDSTVQAMTKIVNEANKISAYRPKNAEENERKEKRLLELRVNYLEQLVQQRDGFSKFEALVDKNGKVVPAVIRQAKQGWKYWAILKDPNDPVRSVDIGKITHSKAKDPTEFYAKKGYKLVNVVAPAKVVVNDGEAMIVRSDGGYNPHAPIIK